MAQRQAQVPGSRNDVQVLDTVELMGPSIPVAENRLVLVRGQMVDGREIDAIGKSWYSQGSAIDDGIERLNQVANRGPAVGYHIEKVNYRGQVAQVNSTRNSYQIRTKRKFVALPRAAVKISATDGRSSTVATGKVWRPSLLRDSLTVALQDAIRTAEDRLQTM